MKYFVGKEIIMVFNTFFATPRERIIGEIDLPVSCKMRWLFAGVFCWKRKSIMVFNSLFATPRERVIGEIDLPVSYKMRWLFAGVFCWKRNNVSWYLTQSLLHQGRG